MMRSLYSGISGLKNHQTRMDVIGNNIANVNTIGFKTSRVVFQDIYSQTLRAGSAGIEPAADGTGGMGGTNPAQIGLGVKLGSIDVIHTSAPTQRTDNPLDLAIDGDGYFIVQNPQTLTNYYSRAGNFRLDDKGNLVTSDGFFVMGYKMEPVYSETETAVNRVMVTSRNGDTSWLDITQVASQHLQTLQNSTVSAKKLAYDIKKAEEAVYKAAAASAAASAGQTTPPNAADTIAAAQAAATTVSATYKGVADAYTEAVTAMVAETTGASDTTAALAALKAKANTAAADADAMTPALTGANKTAYIEACEKAVKVAEDLVKYNPNAAISDIQTAIEKIDDDVVAISTAASAAVTAVGNMSSTADASAVSAEADALVPPATDVTDAEDEYVAAVGKENEAKKALLQAIEAAVEKAVNLGTFELPSGTTAAEYASILIENGIKNSDPITEDGPAIIGSVANKDALATIKLAEYVSIAVDFDGTIYGIKNDIREPIAMLGIALFANPSGLEKAGSSLYRKSGASGEPVETTPQQGGAGLINGGGLEMSNVDLAAEFTDMIVTQRGYQANSRIITVSDSMLEELVNLKR